MQLIRPSLSFTLAVQSQSYCLQLSKCYRCHLNSPDPDIVVNSTPPVFRVGSVMPSAILPVTKGALR